MKVKLLTTISAVYCVLKCRMYMGMALCLRSLVGFGYIINRNQ